MFCVEKLEVYIWGDISVYRLCCGQDSKPLLAVQRKV